MKYNKISLILLFFLILFPFSNLISIEFGGPISEDTTWSPDDNPYIIVNNVQVLAGVTLNILPGTEIFIYSGLAQEGNTSDFYWVNGEAVAKMFWVDGKIIAEGTEQDSIIFSRYEDEVSYKWGTIYFPEGSPESKFRFCKLEHSYKTGFAVGNVAHGALSCKNGKIDVENCEFVNNFIGIWLENTTGPMLIYKNTFRSDSVFPTNDTPRFISLNNTDSFFEHNLVVARNRFYGYGQVLFNSYPASKLDFIFNHYENLGYFLEDRPIEEGTSNSYGNYAINCSGLGLGGSSYSENDTVYVRKNIMLDCMNTSGWNNNIMGAGGYNAVIADNYIDGPGGITIGGSISNRIYNNVLINDYLFKAIITEGGHTEIFNNIIIDYDWVLKLEAESHHVHNNIYHNNENLFYIQDSYITFENNIVTADCQIPGIWDERAIFRNNCLTDDVPDGAIDGGGNIWEDPLFADTLSGDFHLLPGSPCIDAGYDTTYTSTFDADYFHRVADGLNDGNAIIDMGAFEFGSSFIGGIRGYAYRSENGEPLDIVKLKINGQPPEYSDSLGFFEFKLHEGTYNINCSRFYYDDLQVNGIEVIEGEYTDIEIYMDETVQVDEQEEISKLEFRISNFPNPFKSSTTISFNLTVVDGENAEISIYNVKGQKIKKYSIFNPSEAGHGNQSSIFWNGTDENNNPVSSGIYFYKLKTNKLNITNKMLIIK